MPAYISVLSVHRVQPPDTACTHSPAGSLLSVVFDRLSVFLIHLHHPIFLYIDHFLLFLLCVLHFVRINASYDLPYSPVPILSILIVSHYYFLSAFFF